MTRTLTLAAVTAVAALTLTGCAASQEDLIDSCPDATKAEITSRVGSPSAFHVTRTDKYQVEGKATVKGRALWWGCTPNVNGTGRVNIDVRVAKSSRQIFAVDVKP